LPIAPNRCASLKAAGLLTASTTAAQAEEAQQKLRDYGWENEASVLHASLAAFEVAPAVAVTFANGLARASVKDNLCGFSYASTAATGTVNVLPLAALAPMFATGNGVPPSGGINLVNNNGKLGAARDFLSMSSNGTFDWNLEGALCLRNLLTGSDAPAKALQAGMQETQRNGNLHGKPAIIVHGRSDALLPVNHTSRPYVALNAKVEGAASRLSYIEVTNAQHFDSFIGLPTILPGYDTRFAERRQAPAREPGGAHRGARRHARQRSRDHAGEPARHRREARGGGCHRGGRRQDRHPRLRPAFAPAAIGLPCAPVIGGNDRFVKPRRFS